jgi:hypothetical protein
VCPACGGGGSVRSGSPAAAVVASAPVRFSPPVWRVWLGRVGAFVGLALLFLPFLVLLWCLVSAVLVALGWLPPVRL